MDPKIVYTPPFTLRECVRCHQQYGPIDFCKTKSPFYEKGHINLCNNCLKDYLRQQDFSWDAVDKLCQYLDIPFIPKEFEKMRENFGEDAFPRYADIFHESEYETLSWGDYFKEFQKLQEAGAIVDELPKLSDKHRRELKEKWGANYDDEELHYLEALYDGLLMTQNVSGALQMDQALKVCKISLELDSRIREGTDFDKMLASYEKLVKAAEFTPKNVKNAGDFDSIGELVKWLEKRGFRNTFYDDVTRDIVDETIKNIQNYNQRLYTNESGIGEEITRRIEALKNAQELENYYGVSDQEYDLDNYDNEGYTELMKDEEEFIVELDGGDE